MNIFYLDEDLEKCAQYHCDKHVVKMITEYAQLLCSAYYFTSNVPENIYKLTHKNHPCAIWTRESLSNWVWLRELGLRLYKEYKHRYNNKIHKSAETIEKLNVPELKDVGITKRPQAMPDQYKHMNPVIAYRNYYNGDKQHLLKYKNREVPSFIRKETIRCI